MKVIYTDKPGKERGVCYRLLSEFFGVIGSATEVVVDGDAPDIFDAYQAAGIKVSDGKIILATYLGKPVFMDDALVYGAGKYLSVFFGQGAFGYGEGTPKVPVELERKPGGGNGGGAEVLWERKTYILQPAGFSWKGSEAQNLSPTSTQYAAAANWQRVFSRKQVPFAAVISGTTTP